MANRSEGTLQLVRNEVRYVLIGYERFLFMHVLYNTLRYFSNYDSRSLLCNSCLCSLLI
jgi:hypothetical protein